MLIELKMPELGEGVTEGTIVRWLKGVGASVAEGEVIAEIMTEKVNVEFNAPAAGTLREIRYPEEAVARVGAVIALIEVGG